MIPEAMTSHDRSSISFDSSLASTVNYSVAYSSDLVATINHNSTNNNVNNTVKEISDCQSMTQSAILSDLTNAQSLHRARAAV